MRAPLAHPPASPATVSPCHLSGSKYTEYREGHKGPVATAMCYAMPDGMHVIVSCGKLDHTIVVWEMQSSEQLYSIEVSELSQSINLGYSISKDHVQARAAGHAAEGSTGLCTCTGATNLRGRILS